MTRDELHRFVPLLVLGVLTSTGAVGETPDVTSAGLYDRVPALRQLMDSVTFYHSFDRESLRPTIALGDWHPVVRGAPRLAPGLRGKALVAGTGSLLFKDPRNWTIATRGALAFWISPVNWNHEQAGNTNFVLSASAAFYVERQGPLRKPDGQWRRLEALLVGVQRGPKGNKGAGCRGWQLGEWHLVAVNWSWPQLSLSIDGQPFTAVELPAKPDRNLFGGLILGSTGGDETLLDEFFCFNRPLSQTEVEAVYRAFPRSKTER